VSVASASAGRGECKAGGVKHWPEQDLCLYSSL
jgi:hypothetical protein